LKGQRKKAKSRRPLKKGGCLSPSRKYGLPIKTLLKKSTTMIKWILGPKHCRESLLKERKNRAKKLHFQAVGHAVELLMSPRFADTD
jgi:hypothetical protein